MIEQNGEQWQMYSYRFASYLSSSIFSITSINVNYPSIFLSWILLLIGNGFILYSLNTSKIIKESNKNEEVVQILNVKSFLIKKYSWISVWVFNFCIISFKINSNKKTILKCLFISLGLIIYVWFILKLTMHNLIPFIIRIFWLIFSTILVSIGYCVSSIEKDMLKKIQSKKWVYFLYNLIQYVALFLFVLFYFIIKSYSGFIGQMQNMILMYALTISLGNYVQNKLNNRFYVALISSFLFQVIMITFAAIISFF